MGQYAENPNPNPPQEIIVYRPGEKEFLDQTNVGVMPQIITFFVVMFMCFIFTKVFVGMVAFDFIKSDYNWVKKHEEMEKFTTIAGLVVGAIAGLCVLFVR